MMHLTSRLPPPSIALGGLFARQQPCLSSLSAKWRHRIQADVNTDKAVTQDGLLTYGDDFGEQARDDEDGISWLNRQQDAVLQEESKQLDAIRRQRWLRESGQIAQPSGPVDETAPERTAFYRRLMVAAKQGATADAEEVVRDMAAAGLMPGPRAYHGLVFTYVKAGDAEGALDAVRSCYEAGIQPAPESYTILIHAFMQQDNVEDAELVLESCVKAKVDARPAWLMLTQALFAKGFTEAAQVQLNAGLDRAWVPNATIFEYLIRTLCESGKQEEARMVVNSMNNKDVLPEERHFIPIIRAEALGGALEQATSLVTDMSNSILGNRLAPTAESFNALLEGYVYNGSSGEYSAADKMKEVLGMMATHGNVAPNRRTYALQIEGFLKSHDLEDAVESFFKMRLAAEGPVYPLAPVVLAELLAAVATAGRPAELLQILRSMEADGQRLPEEAMWPLDEEGHSFLSAWLVPRYLRLRARANRPSLADAAATAMTPAMVIEELDEEDEIREVDGVLLNQHNFVVDADGTVQSPSKLTVLQLRVELAARSLMTEGNRRDIYKRLQAARRSVPPDVVADMKRKQASRSIKSLKARGVADGVRAAEKRERERARPTVMHWINGQLVEEEEEVVAPGDTLEEEDEEEDDDEEGDDEEDAAPKGQQSAYGDDDDDVFDSRYQSIGAAKEAGTLGTLITGNLELQALNRLEFYNNADAGADMAAQMLRLLQQLDGVPSLADITMIIKTADAEKSLKAAQRMVSFMDASDMAAIASEDGDETAVAELYHTCARICLQAEDQDAAEQCLLSAQRAGFQPDTQLLADLGPDAAARLEEAALVYIEDMPAVGTSWDSISYLEDSVDDSLL